MIFNVGDYVVSQICNRIFGKVKEVLDDKNFLLKTSQKVILCDSNFYRKQL
jgi:hypothetical protein